MKDNENMNGQEEEMVEGEGAIKELPGEEILRLQAALDAKTKEAEENYAKFLRACADLENYKKRAEKEKADIRDFANEKLIVEVLSVMDNFERALDHANEKNLDSLKQGVKLTVDQMYALFKKYGLQEIKSVGEKFDPALHHAISHEESVGAAPGTVLKEFQKGYLLRGRLLRPAMVAVVKDASN